MSIPSNNEIVDLVMELIMQNTDVFQKLSDADKRLAKYPRKNMEARLALVDAELQLKRAMNLLIRVLNRDTTFNALTIATLMEANSISEEL